MTTVNSVQSVNGFAWLKNSLPGRLTSGSTQSLPRRGSTSGGGHSYGTSGVSHQSAERHQHCE